MQFSSEINRWEQIQLPFLFTLIGTLVSVKYRLRRAKAASFGIGILFFIFCVMWLVFYQYEVTVAGSSLVLVFLFFRVIDHYSQMGKTWQDSESSFSSGNLWLLAPG